MNIYCTPLFFTLSFVKHFVLKPLPLTSSLLSLVTQPRKHNIVALTSQHSCVFCTLAGINNPGTYFSLFSFKNSFQKKASGRSFTGGGVTLNKDETPLKLQMPYFENFYKATTN